MSKRKRQNISLIKDREPVISTVVTPGSFSAATLSRSILFNAQSWETSEKIGAKIKSRVWPQYHETIKRIERAQTVEALVDLAPEAVGLARNAWYRQARQFGPEILPVISDRLRTMSGIPDEDVRTVIIECLGGELRWRGEAGAKILLERFDQLDYYGRSFASIVLGLLDAQAAADLIWKFYQKAVQDRYEAHFIGALWGLIDLKDIRVPDALLDFLIKRRYFAELFGLLSIAGDERAIIPLLLLAIDLPEETKFEPLMSASGISHRIGRDILTSTLEEASADDTGSWAETMAEAILDRSQDQVEEYFAIFYRPLSELDAEGITE